MILIDANVILRFLMKDQKEMWEKAEELIENNICYTIPEVIAEVIYVLSKYYRIQRTDIRDAIIHLFDKILVENREVMICAVNIYAERNVDFVDGILIARAKLLRENVFTFDKKVNRLIEKG